MSDGETVIEMIQRVFAGNAHPGGRFLQGSFEGCEPYDEVGPFESVEDWRSLDAGFLDGHFYRRIWWPTCVGSCRRRILCSI